jgi:hypothetical protein
MRTEYASPDIDTASAQRQAASTEQQFVAFQSVRELAGSTDASFSFGIRASRPAGGAAGDRYFATDRQTLYVYSGVAWQVVVGFDSGTNAARAAITPDATDDGAFYFTTDTLALWEVVAGAWVERFRIAGTANQITVAIAAGVLTLSLPASPNVTTGYNVGGNQIIGTRKAAVADVASPNATDLATALTLANETKAQLNALLSRLRASTGHGVIS